MRSGNHIKSGLLRMGILNRSPIGLIVFCMSLLGTQLQVHTCRNGRSIYSPLAGSLVGDTAELLASSQSAATAIIHYCGIGDRDVHLYLVGAPLRLCGTRTCRMNNYSN